MQIAQNAQQDTMQQLKVCINAPPVIVDTTNQIKDKIIAVLLVKQVNIKTRKEKVNANLAHADNTALLQVPAIQKIAEEEIIPKQEVLAAPNVNLEQQVIMQNNAMLVQNAPRDTLDHAGE